jgi:hypothetical protein
VKTGKREEITLEATVHKIRYTAIGANCALVGIEVGTHEDMTSVGNTTVKAFADPDGVTTGDQIEATMTTP